MKKKEELLAEFYIACAEKGYLDMTDSVQSLKAKVIAEDLGLKYKNIGDLFSEAEKYGKAELERREKERVEKQQLEERKKIPGEYIYKIKGNGGREEINVYRRPDGSVYYIYSKNTAQYEGAPDLSVFAGGILSYTYHPSETIYTGASVGGVHMGGFHETEAYYSEKAISSDKGFIKIPSLDFSVESFELSDSVIKAFRRTDIYKRYASNGFIRAKDNSQSTLADATMKMSLGSGISATERMQMVSMAAEMQRLPMSDCRNIVTFIGDITAGNYPDSDETMYQKAVESYEKAQSSQSLKEAEDLFERISDYRDSAAYIPKVKALYEEVLQKEKEEAILKREAQEAINRENRKKTTIILIIVGIILAIIVVAIVVYLKTIRPKKQYEKAVGLMEAGNYEEAEEILWELDPEENQELISECVKQICISNAKALVDQGKLSEALRILISIDYSEDFAELMETCQESLYQQAGQLFDAGDYRGASEIFGQLLDYADSSEKASEAYRYDLVAENYYNSAVSWLTYGRDIDHEDVQEAYAMLSEIPKYKDVETILGQFVEACIYENDGSRYYDENGRYIGTGSQKLEYDDHDRVIREGNDTYEYNSDGTVNTSYYYGMPYTHEYEYDSDGNIIKMVVSKVPEDGMPSTLIFEYEYIYDNGKVVRKNCTIISRDSTDSSYADFTYDSNGRMTGASGTHLLNDLDYKYGYIWAPGATDKQVRQPQDDMYR